MARRVVILGGGITGLAAAYRLQCSSPDIEIVLIEQERRLGGKILSERIDGFVIEGGPDSFLASKTWAVDLCRELGLEDRLQGTQAATRRTFVMCDGTLHQLPEGLTGLVPSRLEPLLESQLFSPAGKQRLRQETEIPPRPPDADEALASFVERRFGVEVYDRLIEPLMSGIYAGDGRQLSLQATFPQLRSLELDHGSVIRGLQSPRPIPEVQGQQQPLRPGFLTPVGGMAEVVEALEAAFHGVTIITGQTAHQIWPENNGYAVALENGEAIRTDAVIITTPAYVAAKLIAELDPELSETLSSIPYVSTATVSVAYALEDLPDALDGYGYVVPRREGRPVLACTWTSSKFACRAPEGYALLRAFLGRAGQEEVLEGTDEDLLRIVAEEVEDVLRITAPPTLHRIYRWPGAMPQYTLGHLDRIVGIEECLTSHPGLFLAGNAYRGIGIPDSIHSGEIAAARTSTYLS